MERLRVAAKGQMVRITSQYFCFKKRITADASSLFRLSLRERSAHCWTASAAHEHSNPTDFGLRSIITNRSVTVVWSDNLSRRQLDWRDREAWRSPSAKTKDDLDRSSDSPFTATDVSQALYLLHHHVLRKEMAWENDIPHRNSWKTTQANKNKQTVGQCGHS